MDSNILDYCIEHSSDVPNYLKALERETHLKALKPGMITNQVQGRFLSFISKIMRPALIVEIGSFTGYSAMCLAEGLADGGQIISYEVNREMEYFHHKYLPLCPYRSNIRFEYGDARELLLEVDQQIDLVFMDANKKDYLEYQELVLPKLRKGGVIITDNTLWKGKVLEDVDHKTKAVNEYNRQTTRDERFENVLIPLDDGYQLLYKK